MTTCTPKRVDAIEVFAYWIFEESCIDTFWACTLRVKSKCMTEALLRCNYSAIATSNIFSLFSGMNGITEFECHVWVRNFTCTNFLKLFTFCKIPQNFKELQVMLTLHFHFHSRSSHLSIAFVSPRSFAVAYAWVCKSANFVSRRCDFAYDGGPIIVWLR